MSKSSIENSNNENLISENKELKSCFIVTPIGEPNSETNKKAFGLIKAVMEPVLKSFNYKPVAASDISSPGSINKQIIIHLYEDDLVIANLTGLNPNVMYELAVRHAVKKAVIIMAEKGTRLPFDLVDQRCIFYEDNLHGVETAKELLENFLSTTLNETIISNPIYDSINEGEILKKITNTDDPTKYIINKLDRLESALGLMNGQLVRRKGVNSFDVTSARVYIKDQKFKGQKLLDEIKKIDDFAPKFMEYRPVIVNDEVRIDITGNTMLLNDFIIALRQFSPFEINFEIIKINN